MTILLQTCPFLFPSRTGFFALVAGPFPIRVPIYGAALESRSVGLPNRTLKEQHKRGDGSRFVCFDRTGPPFSNHRLRLSPAVSLFLAGTDWIGSE